MEIDTTTIIIIIILIIVIGIFIGSQISGGSSGIGGASSYPAQYGGGGCGR